MDWRLLTDNGVTDSFGLAADESLATLVGEGSSPPTLRLYTYQSHCALVGRFQNIENEIHVDYCRENQIPINRRPTGGGAIIMGEDQLGVALVVPGWEPDGFYQTSEGSTYRGARKLMDRFSAGLVRGLKMLGLEARFRRKNDIEINSRKIVGLGIYRAPNGGLLFHASLLVDLDVPLMLQILNTPFEKISAKEITTIASRTTTVRKELGREISIAEVRDRVGRGFASAFGVNLVPGNFTAEEGASAKRLEEEKYRKEDWIFQNTKVPDAVGSAIVKTDAGLLDVRVTLAGRQIKAAYIGGDFFAAENAIADFEGNLRWQSSTPAKIKSTLEEVFERHQDGLDKELFHSLVKAVQKATLRAKSVEKRLGSDPYGCFVTPGGVHV